MSVSAASGRIWPTCGVRGSFVFSHTSAALLHGLSSLRVPETIHVSTDRKTASADPRVRVYRLPQAVARRTHLQPGIPVTDLERTLLDCAASLPFDDAVVLADQTLQREVSRDAVLTLLDSGPRMRGAVAARRVLAFADPRAESALESLGRVRLAAMPVPMPQLQVPVQTHRGRKRLDFGWPHLRLGLELDGKAKYFRGGDVGEAVYRERQRQLAIEEAGWVLLRAVWADVVHRADQLELRLVQALARRARQLGVPVFSEAAPGRRELRLSAEIPVSC